MEETVGIYRPRKSSHADNVYDNMAYVPDEGEDAPRTNEPIDVDVPTADARRVLPQRPPQPSKGLEVQFANNIETSLNEVTPESVFGSAYRREHHVTKAHLVRNKRKDRCILASIILFISIVVCAIIGSVYFGVVVWKAKNLPNQDDGTTTRSPKRVKDSPFGDNDADASFLVSMEIISVTWHRNFRDPMRGRPARIADTLIVQIDRILHFSNVSLLYKRSKFVRFERSASGRVVAFVGLYFYASRDRRDIEERVVAYFGVKLSIGVIVSLLVDGFTCDNSSDHERDRLVIDVRTIRVLNFIRRSTAKHTGITSSIIINITMIYQNATTTANSIASVTRDLSPFTSKLPSNTNNVSAVPRYLWSPTKNLSQHSPERYLKLEIGLPYLSENSSSTSADGHVYDATPLYRHIGNTTEYALTKKNRTSLVSAMLKNVTQSRNRVSELYSTIMNATTTDKNRYIENKSKISLNASDNVTQPANTFLPAESVPDNVAVPMTKTARLTSSPVVELVALGNGLRGNKTIVTTNGTTRSNRITPVAFTRFKQLLTAPTHRNTTSGKSSRPLASGSEEGSDANASTTGAYEYVQAVKKDVAKANEIAFPISALPHFDRDDGKEEDGDPYRTTKHYRVGNKRNRGGYVAEEHSGDGDQEEKPGINEVTPGNKKNEEKYYNFEESPVGINEEEEIVINGSEDVPVSEEEDVPIGEDQVGSISQDDPVGDLLGRKSERGPVGDENERPSDVRKNNPIMDTEKAGTVRDKKDERVRHFSSERGVARENNADAKAWKTSSLVKWALFEQVDDRAQETYPSQSTRKLNMKIIDVPSKNKKGHVYSSELEKEYYDAFDFLDRKTHN